MAQSPLMNSAQMWASNPGLGQTTMSNMAVQSSYPYERSLPNTANFQVERVDNGFILRSNNKIKICKDMEELRYFFVAIMVEHQMDK